MVGARSSTHAAPDCFTNSKYERQSVSVSATIITVSRRYRLIRDMVKPSWNRPGDAPTVQRQAGPVDPVAGASNAGGQLPATRLYESARTGNEKAIDDGVEVCDRIALHQEMVKAGSRRGAPQGLARRGVGDE